MSVREYVGARYVPLFADPLAWDSTKTYEPLTVVYHQGNSYTSRQYVPAGIEITNESYWALTGNYNAQIEQYRSEVATFNNRIAQNTSDIATNTSDIATNTSDIATNTSDIAANTRDIAANTSDIATNTSDIAANTSDIAANTRDIAAINRNFKGANVVWVGDSWTVSGVYGVTTPHQNIVSNVLGFANMYGSFIGSRGYIANSGGATFLGSLQTLAADTSFANSDIDYVIIEGSINDYQNSTTDIVSAMTTAIVYARQTFTKAQVIIIPTTPTTSHNSNWFKCAVANRIGAQVCGAMYIKGTFWIFAGLYAYSYGDGTHPNQAGQEYFSRALCQGLTTGNANCRSYAENETMYSNINLPFNIIWYNQGSNYMSYAETSFMLNDKTIMLHTKAIANAMSTFSDVDQMHLMLDEIELDGIYVQSMNNHNDYIGSNIYGITVNGSSFEFARLLVHTDITNKYFDISASNYGTGRKEFGDWLPVAQVVIGVDD